MTHNDAPGIPRFEFSGVTKLRQRDSSLDAGVGKMKNTERTDFFLNGSVQFEIEQL